MQFNNADEEETEAEKVVSGYFEVITMFTSMSFPLMCAGALRPTLWLIDEKTKHTMKKEVVKISSFLKFRFALEFCTTDTVSYSASLDDGTFHRSRALTSCHHTPPPHSCSRYSRTWPWLFRLLCSLPWWPSRCTSKVFWLVY